ncbi:uncharacterized protein LOC121756922 isoform X1 [Salvia splendens]|uniref:uncharacterized protein LOC121756922 isoform X1 n=1 Tax=Salvia splendens TaxID=180675 RepID=UPI001C26908E|nr:uncharacterized protein LOC121756922 isoform X1 [Salvia splendens]
MACRKRNLREEGKIRNDAAAAAALGDALLFTTMCIIGMSVDVHARDGSVYSGIFHTASVDNDYAIVLKKARMIKKGRLEGNVFNGTVVETLVVQFEDLVQIVAKGVVLPSDGMKGHIGGEDIEASTGYTECLEMDAEVVKTNQSKANHEDSNPDTVFDDGRHVENGSQETQRDFLNPLKFQEKRTLRINGEAQEPSLSITSCETQSAAIRVQEGVTCLELQEVSTGLPRALEDQNQEKATTNGTASAVFQPKHSVASTPTINVKSDSCLSAASNPFLLVSPKGSSVKRDAKESKLNPGAKMFCPSMMQHRTVTPPALPNRATDFYMTRSYTLTPMASAREDVDGYSFDHSSVPVKFVPRNNVTYGHGSNDAPYVQPVIGQVVNRTQPVRFTGQYQNLQTSYAYGHPNVQNVCQGVMLGRGPLACMHPVSSDGVQSASGFSPAAMQPVPSLHQVHPPKNHGNDPAQALQLCMTPPIMANVPQPFILPSSIPISQPLYPVLRPIAVPGPNGFFSTKFA